MKELKNNHLNTDKREAVIAFMLNFLDGIDKKELKLSDEKSLVIQLNAKGNFELVLKGEFIPQDSIKNQLAKGDVSETLLFECTEDMHTLTIGTHERVDGVFNDLKKVMSTEIAWTCLAHFTEIAVTEHDFFGKGFIVASLNYPVNKFNRTALNN